VLADDHGRARHRIHLQGGAHRAHRRRQDLRVGNVEEVIRIRTGETGEAAI
jgi:hypothetical protein